MELLVIPNFGRRISPRLDYAESMQLITIDSNTIKKTELIKVVAYSNLERINFIIRLKPDVVICDGISELSFNKLAENNIKIIPWVHGTLDEVLDSYLKGKLQIKKVKRFYT